MRTEDPDSARGPPNSSRGPRRPVKTRRPSGGPIPPGTVGPMSPTEDPGRLAVVEAVARERRSNLRMDPDRPVPAALVDRLIDLAATAPNHRRTHPWRFRIVEGAARDRIGAALAAHLAEAGDPPEKIAKARTKYRRAPVLVVVAARAGTSPTMTAENRDAVSAAIQTLLLGATAAGLASLWSTGAAADAPGVARACGFDPTDRIVGLVYLGWPVDTAPAVERPAPERIRLTDDDPTGDRSHPTPPGAAADGQ